MVSDRVTGIGPQGASEHAFVVQEVGFARPDDRARKTVFIVA